MPAIPASTPLCVDGRMLVAGETGVSRYAQALVDTLPLVGGRPMVLTDDAGDDRLTRLGVALLSPARQATLVDGPAEPEELRGTHIFRAAQVRFGLSRGLLQVRTDLPAGIMHWTYPVPIRMAGWTNIYTVHDVIPLDHPELGRVDSRRLRAMLTRIVASGDRIVTVSEHARGRIIDQLGIAPDRVTNCYQAVVPEAAGAGDLPRGLRAQGYFLYCGMDEPRKNLARLQAAHRASGTRLPLVLVGPEGASARPGAGSAGVIRLPYQPRDRLAALQQGARAMLFPSLAEGFGLPLVEAMAFGTPVLTAAGGALQEVAGGAALLVDAQDEGAIARGIARLASDDTLCRQLGAAGLQRARRFGRARFAARLRAVYARAIAPQPASGGRTGE
jgi:glycosyltransferase involved in cell wall biosynthesis